MKNITIILLLTVNILTIKTNESNESNEENTSTLPTNSLSDEEKEQAVEVNVFSTALSIFTEADIEYVKNAINLIDSSLLENKEIQEGSVSITVDAKNRSVEENNTYSDVLKNYVFVIRNGEEETHCHLNANVYGNQELADQVDFMKQVQECVRIYQSEKKDFLI